MSTTGQEQFGLGTADPGPAPVGYVIIYPRVSDGRMEQQDEDGVKRLLGSPTNTDDVPEGSTNVYFTTVRAKDAAGGAIVNTADILLSYNSGLHQISAVLTTVGSAGTYTKVTVDAKGRITAGGSLVAADLPVMVGDSGSGGVKGAVPAPGIGDAAAGKFLDAAGNWEVPDYPVALPPNGAASGDLTGSYPSPVLVNTGVTAGTYAKVTVDAKGRILAGLGLSASDLPTIPLNKLAAVTANKALVSDASGNPAAATATTTEVNYLSGTSAPVQTQIDAKQEQDDDLDALAAITAVGVLVRTAAGAAAARTIQGASGNVEVTNGDGVGGDPVIDLADTTVTPASYGAADSVAQFTVDGKGRLTSAATLAIAILAAQVSDFTTAAAAAADTQIAAQKGASNGIATLDGSGKIPASQLTVTAMEFKGLWSAAANTPTLVDGTGNKGDFYKVSTTGTQDLGSGPITFRAGDSIIYDGSAWARSGSDDAVNSVNGQTGAVSLTTSTVPEGSDLYFTDERAQDAIASSLTNSSTITFNYNDSLNQISAAIAAGSINDSHISAAAAIAVAKLAAMTASQAVVTDSNGKLTTVAVTPTELGYLAGAASSIQTQLNGKQPLASLLTAIAAIGTNGFVARTRSGAAAPRTVQGTAGEISVGNGDGVSGDPLFALIATGVAIGTYTKVTVDAKGRVTVGATITGADLPVFVGSGASHAPGGVPDPGASAGTTKFLREDSSWAVPPTFIGSGSSHARGYVPDPGATPGTTKFLREDATWVAVVEDAINSGTTTVAPSEDSVYKAFYQAPDHVTANDINVSGATYTVLIGDKTLFVSHSGSCTITLPNPAVRRQIQIVDTAGGRDTGPITLARFGSETIQGVAASRVLNADFGNWTLRSDGANWWIVG